MKKFKFHSQKGVLFIEAALILPLFLYLIFVIVFFALAIHDVNLLTSITRESCRYAAINLAAGEKDPIASTMEKTVYIEPSSKLEDARTKFKNMAQEQCEQKLTFFQYDDSNSNIELEAVDSKQEHLHYRVKGTVTMNSPILLRAVSFSAVPETVSKTLIMRVEDHSIKPRENEL